jgi:hypothetical protein
LLRENAEARQSNPRHSGSRASGCPESIDPLEHWEKWIPGSLVSLAPRNDRGLNREPTDNVFCRSHKCRNNYGTRSRQPRSNLFCLRFANHESLAIRGTSTVRAVSMLRIKILASAVPLIAVALFARGGLLPVSHPCIAIANTAVEIADLPWHADLHVAFTDDPKAATVRVQITEDAEAADFAFVDGNDAAEANACEASPATQAVSISEAAADGTPLIYLSNDGPAEYRIFVRSNAFSEREAAALVVGAGRAGHPIVRRIDVPITVAASSS